MYFTKKEKRKRLCYSEMTFKCVSAVLLVFITGTENVVPTNFRKTLKVHFNKNVLPEIISYLLSVMGLLPFIAIIFQSSFFLRGIKSESSLPCMCQVCTTPASPHPPHPHFSRQPSNGLLGKRPSLFHQTTLGGGDTATCSRGGQIT